MMMGTNKTPRLEAVLSRLGQLYPQVIDLSLGRSLRLLRALGSPENNLPPVIHIAGTNGKGSTLAFLRAIAEAAGLSVHVYTSPHLVRFAERIRIAGKIPNDDFLADLLERVESVNDGHPITFFEATTAAAMLAFAETPADLCLLETGMGGRFDATNILASPALTLIASISLDHQSFLGDTLGKIAFEKAGIIKSGVPCLSVAQKNEAMDVIAKQAEKQGAPLFIGGRDWRVDATPGEKNFSFSMDGKHITLPVPALPGFHQFENAGLALAATQKLAGCSALFEKLSDPECMKEGLRTVEWPARLQKLYAGPLVDALPEGWEVWLDGGHNPGAGQVLAKKAAEWADRPLYLAVGMLETKDARGFLAPLAPLAAAMRSVPIPGDNGARSAEEIASFAQTAGFMNAKPAVNIAAAINDLRFAPGPARILICGSLHLAGAVLADNA